MSHLPSRQDSANLLDKYIKNPALKRHCEMVAVGLAAYAKVLGENEDEWWTAGLLHDLDWEAYPQEHPKKALAELLSDYPDSIKQAIAAHAPQRTGKQPETLLDKYLFACDELSGFLNAVSLMRPTKFEGMEVKSVKKKLKDKSFAANVSREDINRGFALIGKTPEEHIGFLIEVFRK